jgi:hypothetical protein
MAAKKKAVKKKPAAKPAAKKAAAKKKPAVKGAAEHAGVIYSDVRRTLRTGLLGRLLGS